MHTAVLIPAYNPDSEFPRLVQSVLGSGVAQVVVVNDGSTTETKTVFEAVAGLDGVVVLEHAINMGKGAALKTGLNYLYTHPEDAGQRLTGVVTMDADGQHLVEDVLQVARILEDNPESLVLGVRQFTRDIPLRSYAGNLITKKLYQYLVGQKIEDTQTGLRGIPLVHIPHLLGIGSNGYEFELDMLLMCKHAELDIIQQPITTKYEDDNASSHFNPVYDSMKIYFVLLRFVLTSLSSAVIDYFLFILIFGASESIVVSQVCARAVSMVYNYAMVKRFVFYSNQEHQITFPKYLTLVVVSGLASLSLIEMFVLKLSMPVVMAKLVGESIVFIANFLIQRDFIFTRRKKSPGVAKAE